MAGARGHEVRIGTSGWNYPASGYGPWTGVFYPLKHGQMIPGTKTKFDEPVYYAERFNTVEINNTFYRPSAARVAQSWAKRTPGGFRVQSKAASGFHTQPQGDEFRTTLRILMSASRNRFRAGLLTALAMLTAGCALTRSHVKSLRDPDASRIRLDTVVQTSVATLNALPAHCGPSPDHRIRDEEFMVYQVIGRIIRVKREHDHDIHIVLEDPDDPRERLVVEANDPDYRGTLHSPFRDQLAAARRMVDQVVGQAGAEQSSSWGGPVVRVTGVGFFDISHFQIGKSRSCIELHPILAMERVGDLPIFP